MKNFVPFNKPYFTGKETFYIEDAVKRGMISGNGDYTKKCQEYFQSKFGFKKALLTTSCTDALEMCAILANIKQGDEVIIPSFTFVSTALAFVRQGAKIVFADSYNDNPNIDATKIEALITSKTKAIITVALFGLSPEYDEILEICKEHNIFLIEDNAECFLGYYKGKLVGTFGDFSSYSFQASKHISCGEGGMLTTNNPKYADIARRFTSLGYAGVSGKQAKITRRDIQDPTYNRHISIGYNYRMSEVQSAVMLGQLERIEELVDIRVKVGQIFDEAIAGSDLVTKQYTPDYCKNSYWGYSMILNTNNPEIDWYKFRDLFQKNGGDGYYAAWKLTYQEDLFTKEIQHLEGITQKYEKGLCPNSEFLQKRMICMKTNYWNLEDAKEQARILRKTLKEFKK